MCMYDLPCSYYRYVLSPTVTFDGDGTVSSSGPSARFTDMPQKPILTLGMDPPEGWLVEAVWAPYDLDNIHLTEVWHYLVYRYVVLWARGLYDFNVSCRKTMGMNPIYLYAGPRDWIWVTRVRGEAANHCTNGAVLN